MKPVIQLKMGQQLTMTPKLQQAISDTEDNVFLKERLTEARWFLKSLQNRNETLLRVATCIVEKQPDFLEKGAEAMKPLIFVSTSEYPCL